MMFSKPVWALTIITFVVISLLDNYMPTKIGSWSPNRKGLTWSFINVLSAFLLLPSTLRRTRASEVMISVALLAFTLIVAYVYIGKIHSILAIPVYEPPVDTIVDFAESGLCWNAPHEVWMYLIAESENVSLELTLALFWNTIIPILIPASHQKDSDQVQRRSDSGLKNHSEPWSRTDRHGKAALRSLHGRRMVHGRKHRKLPAHVGFSVLRIRHGLRDQNMAATGGIRSPVDVVPRWVPFTVRRTDGRLSVHEPTGPDIDRTLEGSATKQAEGDGGGRDRGRAVDTRHRLWSCPCRFCF